MKYYKRLLSVFAVCVLLFATFSITASAETYENISAQVVIQVSGGSTYANEVFTSSSEYLGGIASIYPDINWAEGHSIYYNIILKDNGGAFLAEKGNNYKFTINNIEATMQFGRILDVSYPMKTLKSLTLVAYYSDGTTEQITDNIVWTYNPNSDLFAFNLHGFIQAKQNITGIKVVMEHNPLEVYGYNRTDSIALAYGFDSLDVDFTIQNEEVGLLDGILGWIKNIFTKINDTFTELKNGFSNVVNSLLELPSKLWDLISEGLKGLFVPDEDYMSNFSDKWDELLSQRFGAIYQVGDIITDFVERIQMTDKTNTIYMPEVSLNSVGIPFSFGGYDVKVVPDGFNTIVEVCKKILSIVCTFLFINGLRKKYDEVMGVEQ